jgi:hypothetical protein
VPGCFCQPVFGQQEEVGKIGNWNEPDFLKNWGFWRIFLGAADGAFWAAAGKNY